MKQSLLIAAIAAGVGIFATSCSTESPFDGEGEGSLRMRMVVNSTVTRAETNQDELAEKCIVKIYNSNGLIYRYEGLDNMPSSLALKTGHYKASATTGDSVSASFEKKYYKASEPFDIEKGGVTNVVLNCKIANVVASVEPAQNLEGKLCNYVVTIANSKGSLDFNEENVATAHGYYMQPSGDSSLTWTIVGENEDGVAFTKTGVISNVKSAHEYVLKLSYNPVVTNPTGGAFINVTVNEEEIEYNEEISIYGAPVLEGNGFDLNTTLAGPKGSFSDKEIKIYAFQGYTAFNVAISNHTAFGLPTNAFDLFNLTDVAAQELRNAGFSWRFTEKPALNQVNGSLVFPADMLNRLNNGEYSITFDVTDLSGRTRNLVWNINVSDALVEPSNVNSTDITAYTAILRGTLVKDDVQSYGFEYRKANSSEAWKYIDGATTRASQEFTAKVTELSQGTTYEYRTVADGIVNPKTVTFTTEAVFALPNSGFEMWTTNSKGAYIPGASATPAFWDTGNHGSITMNKNITTPASDILHAGSTSVKLSSQFVGLGGLVGKFAAGNIFAGTYDGTDGTDGILTFGRPFNGSHPIKLRGWANYRPATVAYDNASSTLKVGDGDEAQIYVALTTKTYNIRTKASDRSLFNKNDEGVLAYGEIIWTGKFAPDGQMQQFEITIEPRSGYKNAKPAYIVLVASASREGDYFTGGPSTLYLDDLELIYE